MTTQDLHGLSFYHPKIEFLKFTKRIQNKKGYTIIKIRSDNGDEFSNESFIEFYNVHSLEHNFSTSRTL